MKRAVVLLIAALSVGCDSGTEVTLNDAGCGEPGTAPDQPAIGCPPEIDLGCIAASGAPIAPDVSALTCDGTEPTVVCTPDNVTPGVGMATCTATSPSGASATCSIPVRYAVQGEPMIVCPESVQMACSGPRTDVEVGEARVMASCDGGEIAAPVGDVPADGFAVGATELTWTAAVTGGSELRCTTTVTIEDTTPPTLDCPAQTVIRTTVDAPNEIAPPTASDLCDDAVEITWPTDPLDRGMHSLPVTATDDAGGSATCMLDIDVLDVFAVTGLRVVSAELASDGTTDVTLGWEASTGADVTQVRLERATDAAGPWTELTTLANGAGARTYTDADAPSPRAFYRVVSLAEAVEGGVSDVVDARAIAQDGYHLEDQTVPGISFPTSLYGVVRYPADLTTGPFPLVLFMHGNHGTCRPSDGEDICETRRGHECEDGRFTTTPNAEGYLYLMETLAAQGFVTVSVSANALNCRDGFILERTQLILEHLRRWSGWNGGSDGPMSAALAGAVDLSRVSLVGHSRGGEAVAHAPTELASTPIDGVALASVFGIGPTDYATPQPNGVPFAVLLPACDADVSTLEGLRHYDRGLDPTDPNARAQVLFIGANHNFFNREWRFDDNEILGRGNCSESQQVGAAAQRGMLEVVLSDWIRANTDATRLPAYVRAEAQTPNLVSQWADRDLDLRWSYAAAERLVIDDFEATGAPNVNTLGGSNTYSGMIAEIECSGRCARNFSHLVSAVRPAWRDDPAACTFETTALDATGWDTLSMRFASRIATINDGLTEHELGVRVTDMAGTTVEVPLTSVGRLANGYEARFELEVLTTVRVPLEAFTMVDPSLDLSQLVSVEVGFPIEGGNAEGSIWMSDLELAND